MKVKEDIIKSIKSKSDYFEINRNDIDIKINIKNIKNNLFLLLKEESTDNNNFLMEKTISPILICDENGEILFINNPDYRYYYKNPIEDLKVITNTTKEKLISEMDNFKNIKSNMTNDIYELLIENLKKIKPEILKTLNLNEYKEEAINDFKNNINIVCPINSNSIVLSQDIVSDYLRNAKELKDNILYSISKNKLKEYEKYIAKKECVKQYKKAIETNPELKALNDLYSLIGNDKLSFVIHYKNLKGNIKKYNFKKNNSKLDLHRKTILKHQVLDKIPIETIEKITWRNEVLYDKSNYKPFNFTKGQTAKRLLMLEKFEDVDNLSLNDPKIMLDYFSNDLKHIDKLIDFSKNLASDKEFILNLINNNTKDKVSEFTTNCLPERIGYYYSPYSFDRNKLYEKKSIFMAASNSLKQNKDFLIDYINTFKPKEKECHINSLGDKYDFEFYNAISLFTSSFEFSKLIMEKVGCNDLISNIIPEELINRKEIINIIKNLSKSAKSYNTKLFNKINTIENLKEIYTDEIINENLSFLNKNILENRNFVKEHISQHALKNDVILNKYINDKEILNDIFMSISNESQCYKFIKYYGIDKNSSDKLFKLCSENINFLNCLEDEDFKLFVDGEYSDIENIDYNNNEIIISTPNYNIKTLLKGEKLPYNNQEINKIFIESKTKPNNRFLIPESFDSGTLYFKEETARIIKEKYKLRSKLLNSVISEFKNKILNKDLER